MKKVKITFSQPVKLNRDEPYSEVIVDKNTSGGHNPVSKDVQYIMINGLSAMMYNGLKSFKVEIIE